jgi:hypothetical protein
MPKISEDIIRAVTDAAKIEEVVKDIIGERRQDNPGGLHKAGVNMTCLCPFHDDKNDGNLIIRPSTLSAKATGRNTYRCFVCDAKGGPVQFLMNAEKMSFPDAIRWLGKKYNIPVDDVPVNWTPPPQKPTPPPPPALEIPREWVSRTMKLAPMATFVTWYYSLPWSVAQISRMHNTLWQYCVGGWRDHRVVFWQIDSDGVPRAAKLMDYESNGHRNKMAHPGWIYNQDGCRQKLNPNEHTILKPLFGSHLLKRYPNATVNVVESEKTAIIMANYYGCLESQLWLACGGLKFLQLESMQPLIDQGRRVWLWPDKDGIDKWQEVADKLGSEQVQVYTKFFDTCWEPQDGDKADAADITIRILNDPNFKPRKIEAEGQQGVRSEGQVIDTFSDKKDQSTCPNDTDKPKPDGVTEDEWQGFVQLKKALGDYNIAHPDLVDAPFLDAEELTDPELHRRREVLRQRYNFNKSRNNGKTEDNKTD